MFKLLALCLQVAVVARCFHSGTLDDLVANSSGRTREDKRLGIDVSRLDATTGGLKLSVAQFASFARWRVDFLFVMLRTIVVCLIGFNFFIELVLS